MPNSLNDAFCFYDGLKIVLEIIIFFFDNQQIKKIIELEKKHTFKIK